MPENPNLRKPANGIARCVVCKKVGPEHKHSIFEWVDLRWKRNQGLDRPLVVMWALGWTLVLSWCVPRVLAALGLGG